MTINLWKIDLVKLIFLLIIFAKMCLTFLEPLTELPIERVNY